MKKFIAIALAAVMLASMLLLTGCGKETIVGSWEGELDMAKALNDLFSDEEEADLEKYFKFSDIKLDVLFEIKADGTYTMEVPEQAITDTLNDLIDTVKAGMPEYLGDLVTALGMTADEFVAASGYSSMEEVVDEMVTEEMFDSAFEEMSDELSVEAKYKVEDGKFFTSDDKDSDINEDEYMAYELKGKTLTFTELVGGDEDSEELSLIIFPLVLNKK